MELTVDPEFRDLIPPIGVDELKGLERGILLDGCLDPLKLWNGAIVDGHNRYAICQKHGLSFKTTDMHFTNRDDAKVWILRNQMGRRNLLDYQRGVVAIKLETLLRPKAKEQQLSGLKRGPVLTKSPKRVEPIHVRVTVARAAGLSGDTIRKVKVIEEEATPEQKQRLLDNRASINKVYNEIVPPKPHDTAVKVKVIMAQGTEDQKERMLKGKASVNKVFREIVPIEPKPVDTRQVLINALFEGLTEEEIRERQIDGKCPCCGR